MKINLLICLGLFDKIKNHETFFEVRKAMLKKISMLMFTKMNATKFLSQQYRLRVNNVCVLR